MVSSHDNNHFLKNVVWKHLTSPRTFFNRWESETWEIFIGKVKQNVTFVLKLNSSDDVLTEDPASKSFSREMTPLIEQITLPFEKHHHRDPHHSPSSSTKRTKTTRFRPHSAQPCSWMCLLDMSKSITHISIQHCMMFLQASTAKSSSVPVVVCLLCTNSSMTALEGTLEDGATGFFDVIPVRENGSWNHPVQLIWDKTQLQMFSKYTGSHDLGTLQKWKTSLQSLWNFCFGLLCALMFLDRE